MPTCKLEVIVERESEHSEEPGWVVTVKGIRDGETVRSEKTKDNPWLLAAMQMADEGLESAIRNTERIILSDVVDTDLKNLRQLDTIEALDVSKEKAN
jgi:hypothetical protein